MFNPFLGTKDINRFKSKFEIVDNQCWEWKGHLTTDKYGQFWVNSLKQSIPAHRVAYFIYRGTFEKNLLVCHSCDNPSCVNPEHLFLGTCNDNIQDMVRKGRSAHNRYWLGKTFSDDTKRKRSELSKGKNNPMYGKNRKGEDGGYVKLTWEKVRHMRKIYFTVDNNYGLIAKFARDNNVSEGTIASFLKNRTWVE